MVGSFGDNPTGLRLVVRHQGTAMAMEYLKYCEVEVRDGDYNIVEDFAVLLKKKLVGHVGLRFDELDSLPKETMERFFIMV